LERREERDLDVADPGWRKHAGDLGGRSLDIRQVLPDGRRDNEIELSVGEWQTGCVGANEAHAAGPKRSSRDTSE
jgi:hypothetical protein